MHTGYSCKKIRSRFTKRQTHTNWGKKEEDRAPPPFAAGSSIQKPSHRLISCWLFLSTGFFFFLSFWVDSVGVVTRLNLSGKKRRERLFFLLSTSAVSVKLKNDSLSGGSTSRHCVCVCVYSLDVGKQLTHTGRDDYQKRGPNFEMETFELKRPDLIISTF